MRIITDRLQYYTCSIKSCSIYSHQFKRPTIPIVVILSRLGYVTLTERFKTTSEDTLIMKSAFAVNKQRTKKKIAVPLKIKVVKSGKITKAKKKAAVKKLPTKAVKTVKKSEKGKESKDAAQVEEKLKRKNRRVPKGNSLKKTESPKPRQSPNASPKTLRKSPTSSQSPKTFDKTSKKSTIKESPKTSDKTHQKSIKSKEIPKKSDKSPNKAPNSKESPKKSDKTPKKSTNSKESPKKSDKTPKKSTTSKESPKKSDKTTKKTPNSKESPKKSDKTPKKSIKSKESPNKTDKTPKKSTKSKESPQRSPTRATKTIENDKASISLRSEKESEKVKKPKQTGSKSLKTKKRSKQNPRKSPERKISPVTLTPKSLLKATSEALQDSMLVKIIPLNQGDSGDTSAKKRKSATANSKSAKKLKIKLTPRKVTPKTTPVRSKGDESRNVVTSTPLQDSPLGTNGPSTVYDSGKESALLFEWLISPVTPHNFFDNIWEKKPLLIRRHKPQYFKGLFSTDEFNNILKEHDVQFGKHVDITTYTDGKRETHNPDGRAHAPVTWDYFNNGSSVRLLNPQTYSEKVWKLLSTLQEHIGSFCGANVYLTPAGTQGFAPHYDDIEAFILQLEGKKRWRLYSPRNNKEVLPMVSSDNFTDEDIGVTILDTVLEEGDVLYFPRGFIHQAAPPSDTHSLHLTVSMCQRNTWGDLLEKMIGGALQSAREEDLNFRVSLPRDYFKFMGVVNSDMEDERRTAFSTKIRDLFQKLASYGNIDGVVDQMGKDLINSSLPPVLTDEEMACMIYSTQVNFINSEFVNNSCQLTEDTEIQLIRRETLRLVTEAEEIQVHHCMENPRVYKGKPSQYFVIPPESAPGVEFLVHQYPKYVKVQDLPLEGDLQGQEVEFAMLLYEKALIRTKYPLRSEKEQSR